MFIKITKSKTNKKYKISNNIIHKDTSDTIVAIGRIELFIVIITLLICSYYIYQVITINKIQSTMLETITLDNSYTEALATAIKLNFNTIKKSYYNIIASNIAICIIICIVCECIKSNAECIQKLNKTINSPSNNNENQ